MTEQPDARLRELGEIIRAQRRMADLSLRQLAELTQVSNAYLSQLERGLHQPSLRVLRSIADALDLSADAVLARTGLRPEPGADAADAQPRDAQPRDAQPRDAQPADAPPGPGATEAAILADPALTDDARETLLRVYRGLRRP